jgi:putative ABC transport system substrate-binding protein
VIDRRRFAGLVAGAAVAGPALVRAQARGEARRIGYLSTTSRAADESFIAALVAGLRERGWIEGVDLRIEFRWADGNVRRLSELARDLLRNRVELVVAVGPAAAIAARQATRTVPIVFGMISDPVESGIVASLARPGANATGWANMLAALSAKLVELLREAFPDARRVAIVWNPENAAKRLEFEQASAAAKGLGLSARSIEVRTPHELDEGFAAIRRDRADALMVLLDSTTFSRKAAIVSFAAINRLPAIYQWRDFVRAGGLMSYGPSVEHEWREAARFIDRILRGAAPADMPVEQPTRFELAVNLPAARALGIAIPQSILLRADEVMR